MEIIRGSSKDRLGKELFKGVVEVVGKEERLEEISS